jgi:cytochrome c oxidase cbb3-type subunit 4
MTIETLFDKASSLMTLVSFLTFIGIVWWAYSRRQAGAFAEAAQLPFADKEADHG